MCIYIYVYVSLYICRYAVLASCEDFELCLPSKCEFIYIYIYICIYICMYTLLINSSKIVIKIVKTRYESRYVSFH